VGCITDSNLSHTKVAVLNGLVVGFITLLADSITLEEAERKWFHVHKNVSVRQVPALKVGRLGVHRNYQKQGIGKALMKYAIGVSFRMNSMGVGCRFVTLDAYPASVNFYTRIGFTRSLHRTYLKKDNPNMHYDIVSGPEIPG
jgi:GNAT superfamily N-acetyltransferase